MNGFNQYTDVIKKALNRNNLIKGEFGFDGLNEGLERKTYSYNDFKKEGQTLSLSEDLNNVALRMGAKPIFNQKIGHHPDFEYLKNTSLTENHYIISAFIDIKKSTNLFRNYDNETVMIITNTIQLAAIKVCTQFGGFIHRLQGDGLFVYFGGKSVNKKDATLHCLTALSCFTFFVKNDLKKLFEAEGIERINTTIGIDLGHDGDVLWAMAGTEDVSEITTYSLHTSLASKMQSFAKSNEIVVGDYIKDEVDLPTELYSVVEEKRYIFTIPDKQFNYTQYKFDWLKFLKASEFLVTDFQGNVSFKPKTTAPVLISDSLRSIASENKPWVN